MSRTQSTKAEDLAEIENLVEEYRDRCLWFLRQDFVPQSTEEILHVLNLIERYGDRAGFEQAQRLRQWLQLPTSAEF
jgi:hypothetical protein